MKRTWRKKLSFLMAAVLFALSATAGGLMIAPEVEAATNHTVSINPNSIVQQDFLGLGVNLIPTSLMTNNLSKGYNEAYWEMDRKRIETFRPKVARVWFQPDWMETTKGTYTFNSAKMQAFYKYLDALKSAGTEVLLNYGWKVGRDIQGWYSIPGVPARISAPNDLDAFAASASVLLNELIQNRNYTNVKYLTFYNEPNGNWDFEAPGEQRAYYASMVQKVHDKLTADGRRSLVQIWGPEEWNDTTWTHYMKDHVDGAIDAYSFHIYGGTYDALSSQISSRKNYVAPKPVILSEFGFSGPYDSGWDAGYANYLIKMANEGIKSGLVWQLNGVWLEDPDETTDTNGTYTLWDSLVVKQNPNPRYYEAGLLTRYIPAHSAVIATSTASSDIRAAAFKTAGGDYTIVLETNEGVDSRNVTFNFGGVNIGKTFHKFVYNDTVVPEANALLPGRTAGFSAGTSFTDSSINSGYNVIVYTTLTPHTQVEVQPANTSAGAGAAVQLNATLIDGSGGITWSVIGSGNGSVTSGGLYTAPSSLTEEKLIAVKAASTVSPAHYGIALIRVAPASSPTRVEMPSVSLEGGTYNANQSVTLATATSGATIRYTTNGSTPTASSTVYTGPITLSSSAYLKAAAFKSGMTGSAVKAVYYRILPPHGGPQGYEFCSQETQTCNFPGTGTVAFGANGNFLYGSFTKKAGCNASVFGGDPAPGVFKACYYQLNGSTGTVSTPVFSPTGGTYSSAQTVTIATATSGAEIRYTTNGSTPNSASTLYTGPISLTATTTLKAIALKSGMNNSLVAAAAFTISGGSSGGPPGYTFCANEFAACTFSGTASVAYGANGSFFYGTFTNSAVCNNSTFGGDPAFNVAKKCYYMAGTSSQVPLDNAGFETPATSNFSYGPITSGWTFNNRAGVQRNGSAFGASAAPEGVQTAFIQSVNGVHGELSQSITFQAGTYKLEFQTAKRTNYGGNQSIQVYYDTTLIGTIAPASGSFSVYATNNFTATAGAHTIKLVGTAPSGDHTAFIDDVVLTKLN